MANIKNLSDVWQTLANKVLSSVLTDHGAIVPALDVLGHDWRLFPPKAGKIWRAVLNCYESEMLPSIEAVAVRSELEQDYIQAIANLFNDDDNRRLIYHAEELKRLGMLAQVRDIGRQLSEVGDPAEITETIAETETRLASVLARQSNRKSDPQSISASAWEQAENFSSVEIPTGLDWFDRITGGVWLGMNYWVAGAYKSGKTTLIRNVILNIAKQGKPVGVFAAEGSRELFVLACVAMLATEILLDNGYPISKANLSAIWLMRAWRNNYQMDKQILDAIKQAREIYESYLIQIWDTRDGIKDLVTMRHRVKQAKLDYGTQVFFGDYSQLFGTGGTLFERQSNTALFIQSLAAEENIAFWMLTQKNEQSIREPSSYSAGVKGGGDASAAADFLLIPTIDPETPTEYKLTLHHSRWTATGQHTHHINPTSGLFIDKWMKQFTNRKTAEAYR